MVQDALEARRSGKGGIISGFLGGVLLIVMMTVMSAAKGNDVWYGMKGAAAPFLGERAMMPGFDPGAVFLGLGLHFAIASMWGLGFALFAWGLSKGITVMAGAAYGIVVWLGMYWLVLPLAGLAKMTTEAPVGRAVAYHVFFGLSVGLAFLLFQRSRPATRASRAHSPSSHGGAISLP